ncbi:LEAF RUST 10 DISEASE-RESISTANCE LOCUS RECEPTOR-LIKE PROTEIN KINASE-like 2.5 [Glycine soja]|uniref:LEAF RUST 10 DISEASE-RESISTANCE LOCUS RECEPTOR-LIKE PROTEIN KINASE-like 2.5 n=1 Tax=Glycine soja TaxID=3848 RepID=A0A445J2L7_GLYSO|nr:LEAF RUST 10 DISEASE-RESISTANCE LOCUS RECEPTOR-LIKE PROTEIN KINASE-like 2.5 [Glycine soja]
MTNSFKVKLGEGGFGAVYKGELLSGGPVAVKILNESKGNGEDFINEVASISRTSHVNVVTLVGFCLEGRKKALIYEFMPNGSLDKFIYKKGLETTASLSWDNFWQIAIGIARGLEYLHRGCNTRILHFDIKPHNILLDENFCPKISDFGLAKLCPRKGSIISMSDPRGTIGYVAPEVWNRNFGGVSHKSDVYSYGMMLLEMVGGRNNINAEASHTSEIYFPDWIYKRLEQGGDLRPNGVMATEENEIVKRMTVVGLWCVQTFPKDRPAMTRVVDMLEGKMNSLDIPQNLFFLLPLEYLCVFTLHLYSNTCLTRTSHINVVTLLGFYLECHMRALIYEFMPNGSLEKFIYTKEPETLRPLSCLKISDFGLAKLCPRNESVISMSDARRTMGYVAPETWSRHLGGVSHKSDVYNYGMIDTQTKKEAGFEANTS